jgi:hypothetical protein
VVSILRMKSAIEVNDAAFLALLIINVVGWAGFIKPNFGDCINADVGLDQASPTYRTALNLKRLDLVVILAIRQRLLDATPVRKASKVAVPV